MSFYCIAAFSVREVGGIIRHGVVDVILQEHRTVRFGEYLFGRPKSPEIFGFNSSKSLEISSAKHHVGLS